MDRPDAAPETVAHLRQVETVESPCVGICALSDQDVCIGCARTIEEIEAWDGLDMSSRRRILADLPRRATTERDP